MPAPDDQPLNNSDLMPGNVLDDGHIPLRRLAERVITHLEGDWHTRLVVGNDTVLNGPDDMRILFTEYGDQPHDPHQFYIATYTNTGRQASDAQRMNAFTLPSQIATHLESKTIPLARKRLDSARKQQAALQAENDRRKDRIETIAEALDWNSSSYKTHSRDPYANVLRGVGRRRGRNAPPAKLEGHIGYADDGTMGAYLSGLPEHLVDQIVDLVAAHFNTEPPSTDK